MKLILSTILITSLFLSSCSEENSLNNEVPSFSKLYYGTDNLQSHDFIEKEGGGYLILATIFNGTQSVVPTQSNVYIINTDNEGYILDSIRIKSNKFDRGITLKRYGNEVYVLGVRSESPFGSNNTDFKSIFFKTDLEGNPVKATNDTTSNNATIQILRNDNNYSMRMNDFIIKEDKIVFGGTIYSGNNTGEIVQIYDINSFDNLSISPTIAYEYPNELKTDATNTTVLRVFGGVNSNIKFTTVGQNTISNDRNSAAPPSRNIVRKVFTNFDSPASFVPRIYSTKQEHLGDAFQEEIGGTLYYVGSYGINGTADRSDDIFIMRDDFNPILGAENQQSIEIINENALNQFGNTVVSITQNSIGNIYIASTTQVNNINVGPSHLFKFSASGGALSSKPIKLEASRFYNIRKIKVSADNKILILSSLEFENNARAVGLMKINF